MQDSGEQAVGSEVQGEEDQVYKRTGEEGPDSADRGHYVISAAHTSPGIGLYLLKSVKFVDELVSSVKSYIQSDSSFLLCTWVITGSCFLFRSLVRVCFGLQLFIAVLSRLVGLCYRITAFLELLNAYSAE